MIPKASENNSAENEDTEDGGETVEDGGETIEDGDVKGNKVENREYYLLIPSFLKRFLFMYNIG